MRDDGDMEAYAELYERHAGSARRFARSLCGSDADADDLAAEVLTSLLATLQRGNGPTELVLPYLFASIRHRYWRMGDRSARERAVAATDRGSGSSAAAEDIVEADLVRTALGTLPPDVQVLLWRTEVDDESVDDAVARAGINAHNVAVNRHRARRALGTAYLAQHAEPDGGVGTVDPECRATVEQLAAFVRGRLGVRSRRRIERHCLTCASCAATRDRLQLINTRLRLHPKLPWAAWATGATSTIKAQVSGWLGASAATVAGSGALAVVVLAAPAAIVVDRLAGHESPAAAAASPAPGRPTVADLIVATIPSTSPTSPDHGAPTADAPTGATTSDDATASGDAVEARPPAADAAAPPVTGAAPSTRTAPAPAATPPAADPPAAIPVATAPSQDDGDQDDDADEDVEADEGTGADRPDDRGKSGTPGGATSAGQGNANGSTNGNGNANSNGQANGNGNGNANSNGNGQANNTGQANGNRNGTSNGNGNANSNGQANGNANGLAKGHEQRETDLVTADPGVGVVDEVAVEDATASG